MKDKLNLGCSLDILPGYINVDRVPFHGIDVTHDLNKLPYPFEDNSFSEVLLYNVLEHLDDRLKVMDEIWRICKPGAIVKIRVPFYNSSSAHGEITHKNFFTFETFTYLTEFKNAVSDHPQAGTGYSKCYFKIKKRVGIPTGIGKFIPNIRIKRGGITGLRDCLAHIFGEILKEIRVELEVDKK